MSVPQILSGVAPATPVGSGEPGSAQSAAFTAAPGTAFDAEVVQVQVANPAPAGVADNRLQTQVMLRLGNALIAATLPGTPPQIGTRLPLIYLGAQNGQPQFLLAPQLPQQEAARALLSGPGQLLGILKGMDAASAATGAGGQSARAADAATPIWTNPAQPAQQAARLLAGALRSSGLFYESHLEAWAQGHQPLSTLLAQPQGKLSPLLQQAPASAAQPPPAPAAAAQANIVPTMPPAAGMPSAAEPALVSQHAGLAAYNAVQAAPQAASDPVALAARLPAQLHGVVQQQLQALMQGQVVWEGQLWPGQTARWSLRPDPEGGAQQGQPSAERSWSTQIDLDLPRLGAVQARLQMRGNRVDLVLRRHEAAHERIDAALPQLRAALRSAGLEVGGVQLGLLQPGDAA